MRAFIYDTFGYYPEEEYTSSFSYLNWFFKLEPNKKTEPELLSLKMFLIELMKFFPQYGADVIESRDQKLAAISEFGQVSLVAVKEGKYQLSDLIFLHQKYLYFNQEAVLKISHLKSLWEGKVDTIEEKIIPSFKVEDFSYVYLMESAIHGVGLAENAISYLSDAIIDYGDVVTNTTLVHKRLNCFDTYQFFNPFNFVTDSPMRDLAELYKSECIDIKTLIDLLNNYQISALDASLLLARVMYPTKLFDLLEDYYSIKKSIKQEIVAYRQNLHQTMSNIKLLYQHLVRTFGIRPISWLESM